MTILNKVSGFANNNPTPNQLQPSLSSLEATRCVLQSALDQQARDVCALDLRALTDITDYFIIASGSSNRHVRSIGDKIRAHLRELGEEPNYVSGRELSQWVLLDYGNFVIHIFSEPIRHYYNLEELWNKAPRVPLTPEQEEAAKKLRSGMFGTLV